MLFVIVVIVVVVTVFLSATHLFSPNDLLSLPAGVYLGHWSTFPSGFPSHQISKPFHLPDGESDLEVIRRNKEGGSRADSIDGLTDGSTDQLTDNEEEQWIENESEEKKKKRDLVAEKRRKSGFGECDVRVAFIVCIYVLNMTVF